MKDPVLGELGSERIGYGFSGSSLPCCIDRFLALGSGCNQIAASPIPEVATLVDELLGADGGQHLCRVLHGTAVRFPQREGEERVGQSPQCPGVRVPPIRGRDRRTPSRLVPVNRGGPGNSQPVTRCFEGKVEPDDVARAMTVLGLVGSAKDIASVAVMWCQAESVTGQTLVVDVGSPPVMNFR